MYGVHLSLTGASPLAMSWAVAWLQKGDQTERGLSPGTRSLGPHPAPCASFYTLQNRRAGQDERSSHSLFAAVELRGHDVELPRGTKEKDFETLTFPTH